MVLGFDAEIDLEMASSEGLVYLAAGTDSLGAGAFAGSLISSGFLVYSSFLGSSGFFTSSFGF